MQIDDLISVIHESLRPADHNLFKAMLTHIEQRGFMPEFRELVVTTYALGLVAGCGICQVDRERLEAYVETYINHAI